MDQYESVPYWAKVPHGITFGGGAASVAIDDDDRVYVFNRGTDPVVIFDRSGDYIGSWGHGEFDKPHGIAFGPDGDLYLVDDGGHFVQRRTLKGDLVMTLGQRGLASTAQSGVPFNRPTHVAVAADNGDIYVTDGYGNSNVHRFSSDGVHIGSWGRPGTGPGEFSLPHNICWVANDRLAICDRENYRVQVFERDGTYVTEWHFHRPVAIASGRGSDDAVYLAELPPQGVQQSVPHIGNRVCVLDQNGVVQATFGNPGPSDVATQAGGVSSSAKTGLSNRFILPHGIAVDSVGDVYVAELSGALMAELNPALPPGEIVSLRKWTKIKDKTSDVI